MSEAYRARLNIEEDATFGIQATLTVEPSDGSASGDCDWLWIYKPVETWNPLTRNEMRLYYYEYQGDAWRIDTDNQPPCVVGICPQAEAGS